MKFKTDIIIKGEYHEKSYVLHDTCYGEHCVEEQAKPPFDIEDGKQYFDGALKVVYTDSEFVECDDEEFYHDSPDGYYDCLYNAEVKISITTEAKDNEEASEKAWELAEEFLRIENDLGLDDTDTEEVETVETTATKSNVKK